MARIKQPSRTSKPIVARLNPLPEGTRAILRTGTEAVAYYIPTSQSKTLKTTIALPHHSTWSSGLHFHTAHTEYLHLLRGSIFLSLDGTTRIISADAGGEVSVQTGQLVTLGLVFEVPKYARHEWGRAETRFDRQYFGVGGCVVRPADTGEEVVVEEWTSPNDISKPLFFWNLNRVITAPEASCLSTPQMMMKRMLGEWWVPFQLFVIFWELDNWPVFVNMRDLLGSWFDNGDQGFRYLEGSLEYVMTFMVLFTAKMLGWLVGVRAVERKRTPIALWEAYSKD